MRRKKKDLQAFQQMTEKAQAASEASRATQQAMQQQLNALRKELEDTKASITLNGNKVTELPQKQATPPQPKPANLREALARAGQKNSQSYTFRQWMVDYFHKEGVSFRKHPARNRLSLCGTQVAFKTGKDLAKSVRDGLHKMTEPTIVIVNRNDDPSEALVCFTAKYLKCFLDRIRTNGSS